MLLWQRREPDSLHYFVVDTSMPREALGFHRPMMTSNGKLIQHRSLNNLHWEWPVDAGCGFADVGHLVVCLDVDYHVQPTDALRVLAFSADPIRIKAGSSRAATAMWQLIQTNLPYAQIDVAPDSTCTGDCDRRVSLELQ